MNISTTDAHDSRRNEFMKPRNLVLMIAIALGLSLVIMAALPQQDTPKPTQQLDPDLESAHAPLYTTQDKAGQASRLTEAVAAVVPGASTAPVPRKNFVDEFIFGKMEKDQIPHAPLAGDEEFMRRAYLDATGLLPNIDQ